MKFYGCPITGEWYLPDGDIYFPRHLKEQEALFDWIEREDSGVTVLWPHTKDGRPLEYDKVDV